MCHELEKTLKERVEELNDEQRKGDEFFSLLSHELRTPLTVITGYADMLAQLPPDSKEFETAINMIKKSSLKEHELIEDVLDISRIVTGRLKCEMNYVNIEDAIDEAVAVVKLSGMSKRLQLDIQVDSPIAGMVGDSSRLRQVFWNLLSNAIKFTDAGGSVYLHCYYSGGGIKVDVVDTGIGIEKSFLNNVFERFHLHDMSSSRTTTGLGIGLSITKYIVESHGGKITCHSGGIGKGSTFQVFLPVSVSHKVMSDLLADKVDDVSPPTVSKKSEKLPDRQVVLVEDAEDLRLMIELYFQSEGAFVVSFATAEKALEYYMNNHKKVSVIVSDIGLPGMSGHDLIRQIRSNSYGSEVPAVAISALSKSKVGVESLLAGFDRYLPKPVVRDQLVAEVVDLL